ncbi:MAG: hypothetical protein MI867_25020 [Pseudomonadales bacterium]|nr:hypothetical protein [Pseudomonadales bacterium]
MSSSVTRKNRIALILTVLAFVLPAALAYLAHSTGFWQSRGTVNKGELINPPINFDELALTSSDKPFDRKKQWWIVYTAPKQCDVACQNSLLQVRQSQIATGPYKNRVSTLLISHEYSDPTAKSWVKEHAPDMSTASLKEADWNKQMANAVILESQSASNAGQIYIVDPMGAIFMTYPAEPDEKAAIQQGKGLVKDLQRVLKLSRIG